MRIILILSLLTSLTVNAKELTISQERAKHVVNLFFTICVPTNGDRKTIYNYVTDSGFQRLNDQATFQFARSKAAIAWFQEKLEGNFVVVSFDNGNCTIQSRINDKEYLLVNLDEFMPKNDSGFNSKKLKHEELSHGTQVSYQVTKDNIPVFNVVATSSDKKGVPLQGMITYQKL